MEAGWLMLTAPGIWAPKHWKVIGRNVCMRVGEMKQQRAMTCPLAPQHVQSMPNPYFSLPAGTETETSLSLSISTRAVEKLRHCAKLTWLDHNTHCFAIPYSSLIKISTCANKKVLAAHSKPCQRVMCEKKEGHKHLCVPKGNCALNVFLQPCHKMWPFREVATYVEKKNQDCRKKVETFSKCPTSHKAAVSFKTAWRAQTVRTCSSMQLFYFLCCIASWLQMAGVCSGLTKPAVGVGQILTSPAASVGEPVTHSYRRWRTL